MNGKLGRKLKMGTKMFLVTFGAVLLIMFIAVYGRALMGEPMPMDSGQIVGTAATGVLGLVCVIVGAEG